MGDVISGMTGPQLIGFVAVVGGLTCLAVVGVAAIAVPLLTSARRTEALVQLKRDLVAAGYPTDDIVRIVAAGEERAAHPPTLSC